MLILGPMPSLRTELKKQSWVLFFVLFGSIYVIQATYSRHLDLLSAIGLLAAFQASRRIIRGGFVWLGLPCSSFVWLSRGSTRRCRLRPKGSKKLRRVRMANRLTRRVCYLWLGCFFADVSATIFFVTAGSARFYCH